MIYSLRGKLIELKPWELILEAGFVGYAVHITLQTYENLKNSKNQEIFLHTRVIYKETEQTVYGFLHEEEAQLFDFLRSLQGVGPQLATNVISHLGVDNIFLAIERKDIQMLVKVPKVGQSIANKILFEAESKKKKLVAIKLSADLPENNASELHSYFRDQLEEALSQLGFQKKEIDRVTGFLNNNEIKLPNETSENLQDWIRLYLRHL